MAQPGEQPVLFRVDSPRVGVRPHAVARRFARATAALGGLCFMVVAALSLLNPIGRGPGGVDLIVGLAGIAALVAGTVACGAQLACWIGPSRRGRVDVRAEGVALDGRRVVDLADVETGWVLREGEGARVELRLRNGNVFSAATATLAEAEGVLRAAGVDADHRTLRLPLGGPVTNGLLALAASFPAGCATGVLAGGLGDALHLPSEAIGGLFLLLFAAAVIGAVRALRPPVVAVGRDGLAVTGAFGSWFAPFADIAAVSKTAPAIVLTLRDGRRRVIATYGTSAARRDALVARIAEGVAAQQSVDLSVRLAALDADGKTAEEWMASLRALADARDDYRRTGLTRDEIRAALDDPRTSPERRVGAAFALAAFDPQLAVTRVRVAAETAAHEPVRAALERAAGGEIDAAAVAAVRGAKG